MRSVLAWFARHRWPRRLVGVLVVSGVWVSGVGVTYALADSGRLPGQGNPMLDFIQVLDSRGINAWNYELSIDRGGLTDPGKTFWAGLIDFGWGAYQSGVMIAIWLVGWVTSFEWMPMLTAPLITVGDSMHQLATQLGVVGSILTFTAFVAVIWMMRGKVATGLYEILLALVLAALATGILSNPIHLVADPGTGLIYQARDAGLEFVGAISHSGNAVPADLGARLVDTFIRKPIQLVNFGTILDGTPCEAAYDQVLLAGPYGSGSSTIRDTVNGCNATLGTYAATPSSSMLQTLGVLTPSVLLLQITAIVLGGTVLLAATTAAYQAVKTTWAIFTGLLPTEGRGPLFTTAAHLLISLFMICVTYVFFALYLEVIIAMFTQPGDTTKLLLTIDIFMVVALLVFMTQRRRLLDAADRLAHLMAARPGAPAAPHPGPGGSGLLTLATVASGAYAVRRMVQDRHHHRPPPKGSSPTNTTSGAGTGPTRTAASNPATPNGTAGPTTTTQPPTPTATGRRGPRRGLGPRGGPSTTPSRHRPPARPQPPTPPTQGGSPAVHRPPATPPAPKPPAGAPAPNPKPTSKPAPRSQPPATTRSKPGGQPPTAGGPKPGGSRPAGAQPPGPAAGAQPPGPAAGARQPPPRQQPRPGGRSSTPTRRQPPRRTGNRGGSQ